MNCQYKSLFHKIICIDKYQIFCLVYYKDNLLCSDFDINKENSDALCRIHETSFMPLLGAKFWPLG